MQTDADMCICCNRTHWKQWCHWHYQLIWAFMHSVNGIIIFSEFDYSGHTLLCAWCVWLFVPPVLWHCWLGDRKGIWPVKKVSGGMLAWFSVCSEVQTCMWPSWCHCHSLSLASVKSRLVLPFWYRLVAWHSGRTSVSGWRTFPVLRSTCSWWVTTNVGKPSAIGQPTRPTQPFILSGSIKWVVSWNQMCAAVYR